LFTVIIKYSPEILYLYAKYPLNLKFIFFLSLIQKILKTNN